jgi:putative membrane protein
VLRPKDCMLLEKKIPVTYVVNKVKFDLSYVVVVSVAVELASAHFHEQLPIMPLTIPGFIGTAISILLSFKVGQSYDRWWEARKVWGSIVNDSRTLVLQIQSLVAPGNEATIKKMALRQIAWCYCLGQSLRGLAPLENLSGLLGSEELDEVGNHVNKPLAILSLHARTLKEFRRTDQLETLSHLQLDNTLVRLCDAQGRVERINTTVFPVTYRFFLHGIIYLFVVTLSLSLKEVPLLFELPLVLAISAPFFLLEKSASHMQDPFRNRPTDTAVTAIARTIEINIKQLLGETEVPPPLPPDAFYLR